MTSVSRRFFFEVEVPEVKRTRLLELGIDFPDRFSLTPLSATGASGLTLDDLRNINSSRIGVSTPTVTLKDKLIAEKRGR